MQPFTILFTLGALGALVWLGLTKTGRVPQSAPLDAGLSALAGAVVGARLVFVAAHLQYFRTAPLEVFWIWQGGLSGFGAVVGALAGAGIYASFSSQPFWPLVDRLALPAHAPAFAAWVGCLLEGCAYGIRLPNAAWIPASPDILGIAQTRWPTQSLGALATLLAVVLLASLRHRTSTQGLITSSALLYHGGVLLGLSLVRADPVPLVFSLRGDAVGAIGLMAIGIATHLWRQAQR
ncbi:MAG: prolipoprotein diacylglyceryl transferase [Anaerolineales bacterium]|nr:prolipoprotein diacylglyceryl transferase [Anaerolineales bacterium]